MARKTKEDMLRTRDAILENALNVFYNKGFSRATIEEIAIKSNCTRGAVYWHFKNKVEIFVALSEKLGNIGDIKFAHFFNDDSCNINLLKEFCQEYILLFENNSDFRRLYEIFFSKTEWAKELDCLVNLCQEYDTFILNFFETKFKKIKDNNLLIETITPRLAALGLFSHLSGLIHSWLFISKEYNSQNIRELINIFLDSLIICD